MRIAAKHWLLLIACSNHVPVPVLSQLVPLPWLLPWPSSLTSVGLLSPSISWKCDGWQVEGERTGLLRARQTHSHYPLVFHLAQPRWSHTHLNFLVNDESLTFLLQDWPTVSIHRRERGHHASSLSVFSHSGPPLGFTSPSPLSDSA